MVQVESFSGWLSNHVTGRKRVSISEATRKRHLCFLRNALSNAPTRSVEVAYNSIASNTVVDNIHTIVKLKRVVAYAKEVKGIEDVAFVERMEAAMVQLKREEKMKTAQKAKSLSLSIYLSISLSLSPSMP